MATPRKKIATSEYKALTQCYPTLVLCIQQSPNSIADQLKPYGVLSSEDEGFIRNSYHNSDQKARKLLDAVLLQVQIDPTIYQTFIEALKKAGDFTRASVNELEGRVNPLTSAQTVSTNEGFLKSLDVNINTRQLGSEIKTIDMPVIAQHFDGVDLYVTALGLSAAEEADVKNDVPKGIQVAMTVCLKLWRRRDPSAATYRALFNILKRLGKHEIVLKICQSDLPIARGLSS